MTSHAVPLRARAVLCDADGTLFPSEDPAFDASADVTQELADKYGLTGDFSSEGLRRATTGSNFRTTAGRLLAEAGVSIDAAELDDWVLRERDVVTAHLATALHEEPEVVAAVSALGQRFELAAVSSSALLRLDACFTASSLARWFPPERRFSAEDSLTPPVSKPDPAIYLHALTALGLRAGDSVAIEDSVTGARSAVAAGIPTLGLVCFVDASERAARRDDLLAAGAAAVATSWDELVAWIEPQ